MTGSEAFKIIWNALPRTRDAFPTLNSNHEGFALLQDAADDLWDAIRQSKGAFVIRKEAVQVAAMSVRFLLDLCPSPE